MSSIWMNVPSFEIKENELQNIISFIFKHERILKEFGAIKIRPTMDCKLALKKRQKNLLLCPNMEQIVKIHEDEPLYSLEKTDCIDGCNQQSSLITDEFSFWSSLSCSNKKGRETKISILPNKSFFSQKTSRLYFDIHRLPYQSLLRLGGSKVTYQFVPHVKRAHGPGAIFPLTCTKQRLFSLDYHHEGGAHHWYIIPTHERDALQEVIERTNSGMCLDHGQLLIDPSVLDKNHIRYHRIIQHPNEFVVLSAGTLAQSFTEDASWSESISFALPSWIEEGHANICAPLCQCNISQDAVPETIDVTLFRHELIQRYIASYLNIVPDGKLTTLTGLSMDF
jgi:hypothetical protein